MGLLLLIRSHELGVTPPPPPPPPSSEEIDSQSSFRPFGVLSDLERLFIAESPRFLWPVNQETNFGAFRKSITDPPQLALDELNELFLEMFVATASGYLTRWEDQVGLPRQPNADIGLRRATILERTGKTPFTRTRRRRIVERYLQPTLGESISLTPSGVALVPDGVPFFSGELSDVSILYFIVEDIENFSYIVYLATSVAVDMVALTRELLFFTPAGIAVSFDTFTPGTGRQYGEYNYGDFTYGGDEA